MLRKIEDGVALLLLIAAGCGTPPRSTARGDEALDLDALPRVPIVLAQRFGSEESPDTGFIAVGSVDMDRDGLVYAMDQFDGRIRVYRLTGQLVRTIGGRRQGPGEFEGPALIGVVGDTVWAYAPLTHRITRFKRDGELISTAQVAAVEVPVPQNPSMTGRSEEAGTAGHVDESGSRMGCIGACGGHAGVVSRAAAGRPGGIPHH